MKMIFNHTTSILAAILLGSPATAPVLAGDDGPNAATVLAGDDRPNVFAAAGADTGDRPVAAALPGQPQMLFRTVVTDDEQPPNRDMPWLGVGVSECPEPLSAQLDLKPGEGLVVTYVATKSPAAGAGLQRNDVLVELDGQMLVDPIQLRKLIQMHADGESVKIEFYRAGKKQSATAKLVLRPINESSIDGEIRPDNPWGRSPFEPKPPAAFLFNKDKLNRGPGAGQTVAPAPHPFDKDELNIQVQQAIKQEKQAMEQAQRAVEDAMRQAQNDKEGMNRKLWTIQKELNHFADGGVKLGKDATVIVKNEGESVRTMVKKDDSGTYVVVADPQKHLTAHDPNGKLLFDGLIESPEQQQKVPKEVWKKVQPMLDQLDQPSGTGKLSLPEDSQAEEAK